MISGIGSFFSVGAKKLVGVSRPQLLTFLVNICLHPFISQLFSLKQQRISRLPGCNSDGNDLLHNCRNAVRTP